MADKDFLEMSCRDFREEVGEWKIVLAEDVPSNDPADLLNCIRKRLTPEAQQHRKHCSKCRQYLEEVGRSGDKGQKALAAPSG